MGFFSNSNKTPSVKIYNQDTLVAPNILRLTKKVEARPQFDFVKQWVYSCVMGIEILVNHLLFKDITDKQGNNSFAYADGIKVSLNPFKQNVEKLNDQKVFEIFKLIGGHYLTVFIQNEDNLSYLKKVGFDIIKFEEVIFSIFDFTSNDKSIYNDLKKKKFEDDAAGFATLYKRIFEKAYNMPNESNLMALMALSSMLSESHKIFMECLNMQISKASNTSIFSR